MSACVKRSSTFHNIGSANNVHCENGTRDRQAQQRMSISLDAGWSACMSNILMFIGSPFARRVCVELFCDHSDSMSALTQHERDCLLRRAPRIRHPRPRVSFCGTFRRTPSPLLPSLRNSMPCSSSKAILIASIFFRRLGSA